LDVGNRQGGGHPDIPQFHLLVVVTFATGN
jgi:hypothetical protein